MARHDLGKAAPSADLFPRPGATRWPGDLAPRGGGSSIGEVAAPGVDRWYWDYWRRLEIREERRATLRAPCIHWFWSERFNQVEALLFSLASSCERILDYGAGDQRLKQKFLSHGFAGRYETLDPSPDTAPTYATLSQVDGTYDAIFCLEVIEHMSLNEFVLLMDAFGRLLEAGGLLAISTPNPLSIVPMWAADAGHVQQFPLADLTADLVLRGYEIEPYRVKLGPPPRGLARRARFTAKRALCYLLDVDYAEGLLVIGRRASAGKS